METSGNVLMVIVAFMEIWLNTQAATKTLDVFNTSPLNKNSYLPPINNNAESKSVPPQKTYISKTQRSNDNFNTRLDLKNSKLSITTTYPPPIFNSYAPPPSGLVTHKNLQLPLDSTVKLPLLLPQPVKANDFAKHPGFMVTPPVPQTRNLNNSPPMLMVEEPSAIILQRQYNKTIEAAKILASTFLETNEESATEEVSLASGNNKLPNSTDIFVVKTQKKAYIIPTHLKKEASKPTAVDELYPLREQFDKAYTINQFIFVIKPEKINFLNKLV